MKLALKNALTEITGMFAFAIYDNNKNTLHLARDRLGENPYIIFMMKINLSLHLN